MSNMIVGLLAFIGVLSGFSTVLFSILMLDGMLMHEKNFLKRCAFFLIVIVLSFAIFITTMTSLNKDSREKEAQRVEAVEQLLIERGVEADMASDTLEDILEILEK